MILIDRDNASQKIILTLDGAQVTHLDIKNDANRETRSIPLGDDLSDFPERYNEYHVLTNEFTNLPTGYYSYQAFYGSALVESGKLLIKHKSEVVPSLTGTIDNIPTL